MIFVLSQSKGLKRCDFKEIESLIWEEQNASKGRFISGVDIGHYLKKLKQSAEFVKKYSGDTLSGFIAFYCNDPTQKAAFITLVLLNDKFRGKGIASELLKDVLAVCDERGFQYCELEVEKDNFGAIRLYEKHGFSIYEKNDTKYRMRTQFYEE